MPKISVIVPVYKVEKYLNRCIDSILSQTFSDFELILVDDGSPDNCGKMCDEYAAKDKRIVVIRKENGGLSDARNAGLDWVFANSDSEYIAFVDSDDCVHEQYLELLYKAISQEKADISICNAIKVDENYCEIKEEDDELLNDEVLSGDDANERLNQNWRFVVAWNKLYKRSIFQYLRYPLERFHEDEFVIHHIFHECSKIVVINNVLYYYLQREGSIMNSEITFKRREDFMAVFRDRFEFFKKTNKDHLYRIYLNNYLRLYAFNVIYLHRKGQRYKIYNNYKKQFLRELNSYKKDLDNNPYSIYMLSIDQEKFDFGQKMRYVNGLMHILGVKGVVKKVFNKLFCK